MQLISVQARRWLVAAGALAFAACGAPDQDEGDTAIAAAAGELAGGKSYIVLFKDGVDVDAATADLAKGHGLGVLNRYRNAVKGAAFLVPSDSARAALARDPRVALVDLDQPVYAIGKPSSGTSTVQTTPTGYTIVGADVTPNEGAGVRVAILDSGVNVTHADLKANLDLAYAKDCVNESGAAYDDNNGHGSHVAGTVAAVNNTIGSIGIATQAKIVPVKVMNRRGSGSWSSIICGIDHVTANAAAIKVANLSLGGSGTACLDNSCTKSSLQIAVERAVAAGVTMVVAAGNEGMDASQSVPAAYPAVITVSAWGSTDSVIGAGDGWPSFTNYGDIVDIAAPGYQIYSTWKSGGFNTISGTSMACPHVAAAAALVLSANPGLSPAQVNDTLRAAARTTYPGSTHAQHKEPLLDVSAL